MNQLRDTEKRILAFCQTPRQMQEIQKQFWLKYGKAYATLRDLQAFGLIRKIRTISKLKVYNTTEEGRKLIVGFKNNL